MAGRSAHKARAEFLRSRPRYNAPQTASRSRSGPCREIPCCAPGDCRVHQERQRHLEGIVDLGLVDMQVEARLDPRHRRQDAKPEAGPVKIEIADRIDEFAGKPDLLLGLAQGGIERRGVGCVDLAAGKGDLAGVIVQMRRTLGQQHGRLRVIDDRDQHRRGPDRLFAREIASMRSVPRSPLGGTMPASISAGGTSKRSRARARSKNSAELNAAGSAFSNGPFKARPSPAPHRPLQRIRPRKRFRTSDDHRPSAPRQCQPDHNRSRG